MKIALVLCVAGLASAAQADIVGKAVTGDGSDIFLSEAIAIAPGYDGNGMLNTWDAGDMFGITSRTLAVGTPFGIPFSMVDDSAGSFPTDTLGLIKSGDNDRFFGSNDTVNNQNTAPGTGTWTFDISGFTGLTISADFAAQGDFEASGDSHVFSVSIDGGAAVAVFVSSVDEASNQLYTLESGNTRLLDDPMLMNGVLLNNNFQTISAAIAGAGSTLTLSYVGGGDGSEEPFAFRNIVIEGVPTPGAAALLGLAGLAAARRRRA